MGGNLTVPKRRTAAPAPRPKTAVVAEELVEEIAAPLARDMDAERSTAEIESGEPNENTMQQMTRERGADGKEIVSGWIRVEFAAGQRHATAHVAICPPFDAAPHCAVEAVDGPSAQVKVAQALPHGARLDLKLDEPAPDATSVVVEFALSENELTE